MPSYICFCPFFTAPFLSFSAFFYFYSIYLAQLRPGKVKAMIGGGMAVASGVMLYVALADMLGEVAALSTVRLFFFAVQM